MKVRTAEGRSKVWDIAMVVLLLGSVILVFVHEALDPVRFARSRAFIEYVDLAVAILFFGEWLWRVRQSAPHHRRYALRQSWELLGMMPLLLPVPSGLRALRLLRLVRILRVFGSVGRKLGVWERIAKQANLKPIALTSAGITVGGAFLVWLLERGHGDGRLDHFPEALWWAIVTVTTVGYGDITPITGPGRFIAAGLMITGIGLIGLLASTLAGALVVDSQSADEPVADVAAQLERLSRLRETGHLDDDEYTRAKSLVLE